MVYLRGYANQMKFIQTALIVLLGAGSAASSAQTDKRNDVAKDGLKGKVKTIIITGFAISGTSAEIKKDRVIHKSTNTYNKRGYLTETVSTGGVDTVDGEIIRFKSASIKYHYDDHNNMIGAVSYTANGAIDDSTVYKVDERGNRIDWFVYKADGTMAARYVSEYNNHGDLLETNEYANGKLTKRHTYDYNDNYKVSEENEYEGNGKLKWKEIFKYNSKGQLTEVTDYSATGDFESRYVYKYDSKGNITDEEKYMDENSQAHTKTTTIYDSKGVPTQILQFNEDGKLIYQGSQDSHGNHTLDMSWNADRSVKEKITQVYKYDDYGNVTFEERTLTDGQQDMRNNYQYYYDENGNWTKKTTLEDGTPSRMVERVVAYY